MKTGKTLQELAAEIVRQNEAKRDFIAPAGKLGAIYTGEGVALAVGSDLRTTLSSVRADGRTLHDTVVSGEVFGVKPLGHAQIAEYCGIDKRYYDRCLQRAPDLLPAHINHWIRAEGKRRLVRVLDGEVRAFLSDSYRPLENISLAEAVLPVLQELDLFVASCEITERRLYIKAFDKAIEREIKVKGSDPAHTFLKDVVFPAITISNSEVGAGSLSVAAGVYTGGCTNFAAFNDARMRKYHVGGRAIDSEEIVKLLSDDTKRKTDAAIWAQTRDVVKSAFEIAAFEGRVARLQGTADERIDGDVVEVVGGVAKTFGLTQTEGKSVLKHLIEGGTLSRYGLFNAVTRSAEDAPDYERATALEELGGRIIELPKTDWERLARAA